MFGWSKKAVESEKIEAEKKNIVLKDLRKNYSVGPIHVEFNLMDVPHAEINNKEEILDFTIMQSRIDRFIDVIKNMDTSKYQPFPKDICITIGKKIKEKSCTQEDMSSENSNDIIMAYTPRWNLNEVYLPQETRKNIETALLVARHKKLLFDDWKLSSGTGGRALVLNFFGPSGTGKSMTAEAIAGMLEKQVYNVNYAQLESKYVGETPKNIKRVFEEATKKDAVLIFDEADSFMGKRLTNVTQSADYGVNITRSVMLMELERFEGLVIFTTNLLNNYDDAFKRRIFASIEFKLPDKAGRKAIWDLYLKRELPIDSKVQSNILAEKYEGLSGADIKDIVLYAAINALYRNEISPYIILEDFQEGYKVIGNRYKHEGNFIEVTHETISEEQFLKETGSEVT